MTKAVIFDLDGVIVDTAKYHYLAWKRLANELGFEFTEHHNERLKGVSRMASLEILLSVGEITDLTEEEKIKLAEKKNQWYVEYIEKITPDEILPGFLPLLDYLKTKSVKTAVGSASKNAGTILSRLGLLGKFDALVDGNRITKAKPDPEVFTLAADDLGVSYKSCVVIEDAEAGIEAALRAGMKCIGIGNPAILSKANRVVASLTEIDYSEILNMAD
ncbi:MAG: beta-phosphoglucomutase [Bacteroidales bacterium]|nr:beta-phosphoglucomutase [Bacteroidales bacterium]